MAGKGRTLVLCLIRCGETRWAQEGRMSGRTDLPLSNRGRAFLTEQARFLASHHIATIYHPGDESAAESATICAASLKARTKVVSELADPDLGLLEGITEQEFADRYGKRYRTWIDDPMSFSPPEGEDMIAVRARIFRAVSKLLKRTRSEEVGVVLHPVGLGLIRCWLADRPPRELWQMLERRPPIERYVLDAGTIAELQEAAELQHV
ncbi:MAG: histidine phosphatase family protein [Phycisphaerales bacterium]|nr:MAG: histidine phosphatase family protein [Phycisphaerales bacterium]